MKLSSTYSNFTKPTPPSNVSPAPTAWTTSVPIDNQSGESLGVTLNSNVSFQSYIIVNFNTSDAEHLLETNKDKTWVWSSSDTQTNLLSEDTLQHTQHLYKD